MFPRFSNKTLSQLLLLGIICSSISFGNNFNLTQKHSIKTTFPPRSLEYQVILHRSFEDVSEQQGEWKRVVIAPKMSQFMESYRHGSGSVQHQFGVIRLNGISQFDVDMIGCEIFFVFVKWRGHQDLDFLCERMTNDAGMPLSEERVIKLKLSKKRRKRKQICFCQMKRTIREWEIKLAHKIRYDLLAIIPCNGLDILVELHECLFYFFPKK